MIWVEYKRYAYSKTMRLVSVIVPVYKTEAYLRDCMDSLLNQTLQELEIILVNDGSPDGSPEICDEYARKYLNVTVLHKEHAGLSQARNAAISIARGEYIGFVDSDDTVDERMYATLLDLSQRHDAEIALCAMTRIAGHDRFVVNGLQIDAEVLSGDDALTELFQNKLGCSVCTKLFRREAIQKIKFLSNRTNEDFPFLVEALLRASKVASTGEGFYRYILREGSITQSGFNREQFDKFSNSLEVFNRIKGKRPGISRYAHGYHCLQTFTLLKWMLLNGYEKKYEREYKVMLKSLRRSVFSILLFNFWPLHDRLSKIYLGLFPRIYAKMHAQRK